MGAAFVGKGATELVKPGQSESNQKEPNFFWRSDKRRGAEDGEKRGGGGRLNIQHSTFNAQRRGNEAESREM